MPVCARMLMLDQHAQDRINDSKKTMTADDDQRKQREKQPEHHLKIHLIIFDL